MTTKQHRHQATVESTREIHAAHSADLTQHFHRLYAIAQNSSCVFGSPLGPTESCGKQFHLPRFVYFGPQSSDDSVRLAIYAGFDGSDARASSAVLHLVERLALTPEIGHGLNLSFFPLVNPTGFENGTRRSIDGTDLPSENWVSSAAPEILLLRQDAHLRAYHGFIVIETAPVDTLTGTLRSANRGWNAKELGLTSDGSDDAFHVRWRTNGLSRTNSKGPLTLADDLVVSPFEFVLRVPETWTAAQHNDAIGDVLRRFVVRYRAVFSYGIHL